MASLLSGAGFGAAMVAAGVYKPSVIISQLKLEDWHMLQVFLTATASSAAIYTVAERLGYLNLKPRSSSPVGLFGTYDGNIVGGALLGTGMALSGSCPGTVLAQVGLGLNTGLYALGGAALGGIAYTGFVARSIQSRNEARGIRAEPSTLGQNLGISHVAALVLFETACLAAVASAAVCGAESPESVLLSARSGLFIGAAQLFSLIVRRSMLGISGSYEELGNFFWWAVGGGHAESKPKSFQNILFGAGVAAGAWSLAKLAPTLVTQTLTEATPLLATAGGVLMVIGSRVAGGCTSGHGISGLSLLSTSSLVTMVSAFGTGALVAPLVY